MRQKVTKGEKGTRRESYARPEVDADEQENSRTIATGEQPKRLGQAQREREMRIL